VRMIERAKTSLFAAIPIVYWRTCDHFSLFEMEHQDAEPFTNPLALLGRAGCGQSLRREKSGSAERASLHDANSLPDGNQLTVECPATFVPESMRQTGMRGAIYGASEEAYAGADRESASAD
jgi:hypothetical protein